MHASEPPHTAQLTSGHLLARNTVWNLMGNGAPMIVAVFCIPILIRGLGKERFGVLALAWALVGYAGLFDLGLGRALTQLVAKKLGAGEEEEIPSPVWTSLLLMLLLGLFGAVVMLLSSPILVRRVLHIPGSLQVETLRSFYLLGLAIPVVISTAGLRSLLQAFQLSKLINVLRIPMGVFMFVSPLFVLRFSQNLFPVVALLVAGLLVICIGQLMLCLRVLPALRCRIAWDRAAVRPLLRFGSWMTVTNIVGPLMVTLDRFMIGAMLSATAVAYYATPFEVVTKTWLFSGAMMSVMFPAFSVSFAQDRNRAAVLFGRSFKALFLVTFPVILTFVVLAQDGLKLWLGVDFAQHSFRVLQWLAVGVFIGNLSSVPFALIQGAGRPDLTAKLYLIELPLYLGAVWWFIGACGIEGAAIAWTARIALDAVALFAMTRRFLPLGASLMPRTLVPFSLVLLLLILAPLVEGLVLKALFLLTAMLVFSLATWFLVLTPEERTFAQSYL